MAFIKEDYATSIAERVRRHGCIVINFDKPHTAVLAVEIEDIKKYIPELDSVMTQEEYSSIIRELGSDIYVIDTNGNCFRGITKKGVLTKAVKV